MSFVDVRAAFYLDASCPELVEGAYKATADKRILIISARTKGRHNSYADGGPKGDVLTATGDSIEDPKGKDIQRGF